MGEVGSMVKIAVTLMIIASIIVTIFCVYSIGSAATYQYYEEQATYIDASETTLNDMYYRKIPVPLLVTTIEECDIYNDLHQIVVHQRSPIGKATPGNVPESFWFVDKKDLGTFVKEYSYTTGYIFNIYKENGYYYIEIKVGAE